MRIVSYNILDGGQGRADPLAEILQAQRADVIALQEADQHQVVEHIARRLKMDYVHAPGGHHAAALLSAWPLVESINHGHVRRRPRNSFLEAWVQTDTFGQLPIAVVHLHPHATEADEVAREHELADVLAVLDRHRQAGRAHLLLGDFNANSPLQHIDPLRCKPRTREHWQANGGRLPRRVIQQLLHAGYVDTFHAVCGAAAADTGTFSTQFPGQRVDYIFSWGLQPSRLRSAWIERDRLAKYASDHYPIGLELA